MNLHETLLEHSKGGQTRITLELLTQAHKETISRKGPYVLRNGTIGFANGYDLLATIPNSPLLWQDLLSDDERSLFSNLANSVESKVRELTKPSPIQTKLLNCIKDETPF